MSKADYQEALTKIAWGYVFIHFNINLRTINVLPEWIGYALILLALDAVAEKEPSAKLLQPFGFILIVENLLRWVWVLLGGQVQWPWLSTITGVISLYFHFQLLTNLADIAKREGSVYWKRIRFLRTVQTVFLTVITLMETELIVIPENLFTYAIFAGFVIFIAVGLVATLFSYKNEQNFSIDIPPYVADVLQNLEQAGHEAYIVGGCVRDALMHAVPKDWDVCTSALPQETMAAFARERTIGTGLKHGTVTVLSKGQPVEVTTYRIDGEYLDNRHPEKVEFTRSLEEDLARRDFTMNAMAYNPSKGIVDIFEGRHSIRQRKIRCVGKPIKRIQEDGLRIMRGLRFAATLGFGIDTETDRAMRECKSLLRGISKERINVELSNLIVGARAGYILTNYSEILEEVAPGIVPMDVNHLPKNLYIRLAAVFPNDTEAHLRALKYDNNTVKTVAALAMLAGEEAPTEEIAMKKFLLQNGEKIARLHYETRGCLWSLEALLEEKPCYSVRSLAVNGQDLIEAGVTAGPAVGRMLEHLLDLVIEGKIENEKKILLEAVEKEAQEDE